MKRIFILLLAALLLGLVSCQKAETATDTSLPESKEETESVSTEEATNNLLFDEYGAKTELSFDSEGRIISRKTYNRNGLFLSHTEFGYIDGYSVVEKTADGKFSVVRQYDTEGKLEYQDVYTETGRDRWENEDGMAVKTAINLDGKKTESTVYKSDAAYPYVAERSEIVLKKVFYENGEVEILNEYENGKQKKSYLYSDTGEMINVKNYIYDEAGKNIRVDQVNANGETELQIYYTYNEKGNYSVMETKKGDITTSKTEYSYDKYGNLNEWLIYKYDEAGNATEYEKWVVTDDGKVLEGTYKVE